QIGCTNASFRGKYSSHRLHRQVAGWEEDVGRHFKSVVKQIVNRRFCLFMCLGISLRDVYRQCPTNLVRRRFIALTLALFTEFIKYPADGTDRAVRLQIDVTLLRYPFNGLLTSLGRNPDRRMRFLVWQGPWVDITHFEIF